MIDYEDNFTLFCRLRGSVAPSATLHALPSTLVAVIFVWQGEVSQVSDIRGFLGLQGFDTSMAWSVMTAIVSILVAFRIKQALGRFWEGTSLLHQMRGEWFDAASCLITFSREAKVNKGMASEVNEFRNTLIRLMSLMHGSALDEISGSEQDSYDVIDIHGLDTDTLSFLAECQSRCNFSKVEAMQHLIQVLVTTNFNCGVLAIPAPIISRVYQTLSRGFVNLLNARKIKDTMFPLPLAQTIKLLLFVLSLFTPLIMTDITRNCWALLFTFVPLFGMFAVNLIAWQLEMPFGADLNDLPLHQFQSEMNDALLMLLEEGSDHLPTTSPYASPILSRGSVLMAAAKGTSRSIQDPEYFVRRASLLSPPSLFSALSASFAGKDSTSTRQSHKPSKFTTRQAGGVGDEPSVNESETSEPRQSHSKTYLSAGFFQERESLCSSMHDVSDTPKQTCAMAPLPERVGGSLESLDDSVHPHPIGPAKTNHCDGHVSLQQLNSLVTVVADLQIGYGNSLQLAEKHYASLSRCLETLKSTGCSVHQSAPSSIGDFRGMRSTTPRGMLSTPPVPMGASTPRTYSPRHAILTPRQQTLEDRRRFRGAPVGLDAPAIWA